MRRYVTHGGAIPPPLKPGDWVVYTGGGTSVAKGTRGKVKSAFTDHVEVAFDCGTILVTEYSNVTKAEPPRSSFYGDSLPWYVQN